MKWNRILTYISMMVIVIFFVGCQNSSPEKNDESPDVTSETDMSKEELKDAKDSDDEISDLEEDDDIEFQFTVTYQGISDSYEEGPYNLIASKEDTLFEALSRHYNLQIDDENYFSIEDFDLYGDSTGSSVWYFTFNGESSSIDDLLNIKIEDDYDIIMQYEEISSDSDSFYEEDSDIENDYTENDYGVREVPIYEGVANDTPDMFSPIVIDLTVYTTPRGENNVEEFGGKFTVDYGTTVLEALNAAYGFESENGRIVEIGGVRAKDLGYDEYYGEWTSVSSVKEVNMSGYIFEPNDRIAIYNR